MSFRNHRKLNLHARAVKGLGIDAVFISLAYSAVETIWSIYIFSFFPSASSVGLVTALFSIASLASLFFLFPLFKRFSPQKLMFASVAINAVILALFAHITQPWLFIILGVLNAVFMGIRVQSFGVLLRYNSTKKNINKNENHIFFTMNFGWIIGPLVAGFISNAYTVRGVLVTASAFLLLSVYSITYNQKYLKNKIKPVTNKIKVLQNAKMFFKDKERVFSYCLSGGIEVWWVIAYIFTPIVMIERYGFSLIDVGIFLFLIIIPMMLIEYIVQRKEVIKLKRTIGFGYLFAALIGISISFISNIYVFLGGLIIASLGMGLLEPATQSYFFRITKQNESERFYGSFMTAKQAGSFVGKMIMAGVILFFSFHIGIFAIGSVMLVLGIWSLRFKKHHKVKHKNE